MKVLLLSNVPPGRGYTGAIVLERLCNFLPPGSLAAFVVKNRHVTVEPTVEMPIKVRTQMRDFARGYGRFRRLSRLDSLLSDAYHAHVMTKSLVKDAVQFGREFGAEAVWCMLEGRTMYRLCHRTADALGVPLLTQVPDPPDWWLIDNRIDRFSQKQILVEFDAALSKSARCGAASWAMADAYHQQYGIETVPLIPSLDAGLALPPQERLNANDSLTIGISGQLYATTEWGALLNALDKVGWKIGSRDIRIRLLGRRTGLRFTDSIDTDSPMHIEFLGWRTQAETIRLLSEVDVNYCPYRFDRALEAEARLCFPSKLTTYLATGRPVLFHGPDYSSPAKFLEQHRAGICCYSLAPEAILASLEKLVQDTALYAEVARNGRAAFDAHLTLEHYRAAFAAFLGLDESALLPLS